jgi:hypothetical protein
VGHRPARFYRTNRDQWRAVWPLELHLTADAGQTWPGYAWTVESTPEVWAAAARETLAT